MAYVAGSYIVIKKLGWIHQDHEMVIVVEDWPLAAAIYVCVEMEFRVDMLCLLRPGRLEKLTQESWTGRVILLKCMRVWRWRSEW